MASRFEPVVEDPEITSMARGSERETRGTDCVHLWTRMPPTIWPEKAEGNHFSIKSSQRCTILRYWLLLRAS